MPQNTLSLVRMASRSTGRGFVLLVTCAVLTACMIDPVPRATRYEPLPPPETEVFFYPTQGQSPVQQDRDRYECYLWAVRQTGFDPSGPGNAPHQQVNVVPVPPPGHDTAVGAATGAAIGAIAAPHGDSLQGMVVGAIAGAAMGAASDAAREADADRQQRYYDQRQQQQYAQRDYQASRYRRAMAACLEGRGYSVQ